MKELVINKCHGGFGLSHEAVLRYAELKGITLHSKKEFSFRNYYTIPVDEFEKLHQEAKITGNWKLINHVFFFVRDIDRDDPILIQVVKELGEKANDICAELKIVQIPDDVEYEIQDYDGMETVAEVHRKWY